MANLILTTKIFTYDRKTRCFSIDLGDIDAKNFLPNVDSITLVSHKTQAKVNYFLASVETSVKGIEGWNFFPTDESVHKVPGAAGTSILILNDD